MPEDEKPIVAKKPDIAAKKVELQKSNTPSKEKATTAAKELPKSDAGLQNTPPRKVKVESATDSQPKSAIHKSESKNPSTEIAGKHKIAAEPNHAAPNHASQASSASQHSPVKHHIVKHEDGSHHIVKHNSDSSGDLDHETEGQGGKVRANKHTEHHAHTAHAEHATHAAHSTHAKHAEHAEHAAHKNEEPPEKEPKTTDYELEKELKKAEAEQAEEARRANEAEEEKAKKTEAFNEGNLKDPSAIMTFVSQISSIVPVIVAFVFFVGVLISLIPLNEYKGDIMRKLNSEGIEMNIEGTLTFNPFLFSFVVDSPRFEIIDQYLKNSRCAPKVNFVADKAYINPITKSLFVEGGEITFLTNGDSLDIRRFLRSLSATKRTNYIKMNRTQVVVNTCPSLSNPGEGEVTNGELLAFGMNSLEFENRKEKIIIDTQLIMRDGNIDIKFENIYGKRINIAASGEPFVFKLKAITHHKEKRKKSEGDSPESKTKLSGNYSLEVKDGGKMLTLMNIDSKPQVLSALAGVSIKSVGPILYDTEKGYSFNNDVITTYGNGQVVGKIAKDDTSSSFSFTFDELDGTKTPPVSTNFSNVKNSRLESIFMAIISEKDHSVNFTAKKIINSYGGIKNLKMSYASIQGVMDPEKTAIYMELPGCIVQSKKKYREALEIEIEEEQKKKMLKKDKALEDSTHELEKKKKEEAQRSVSIPIHIEGTDFEIFREFISKTVLFGFVDTHINKGTMRDYQYQYEPEDENLVRGTGGFGKLASGGESDNSSAGDNEIESAIEDKSTQSDGGKPAKKSKRHKQKTYNKIKYSGTMRFTVNNEQKTYGLDEIDMKIGETGVMKGSYIFSSATSPTGLTEPLTLMSVYVSGFALDEVFSINPALGIISTIAQRNRTKSFLEFFVNETHVTSNYNLNLHIANSTIAQKPVDKFSASVLKLPSYFSINLHDCRSEFMQGNGTLVVDTRSDEPTIVSHNNIKHLNLKEINPLIDDLNERASVYLKTHTIDFGTGKDEQKIIKKPDTSSTVDAILNENKSQIEDTIKKSGLKADKSDFEVVGNNYIFEKYLDKEVQLPILSQIGGSINANIEKITLQDEDVKDLNLQADIANGIIYINKASFAIGSSSANISGIAELHGSQIFNINSTFKHFNIEKFVGLFVEKPIVSGYVDGEFGFTFNGSSIRQWIATSMGETSIRGDGISFSTLGLRTIKEALMSSKTNYDTFSFEDALDHGSPDVFSNVKSTIKIKNGIISTEGITASSVGLSSLCQFSIDVVSGVIYMMDMQFMFLGIKPWEKSHNPSDRFAKVPLIIRVTGTLSEYTIKPFFERLKEYSIYLKSWQLNKHQHD